MIDLYYCLLPEDLKEHAAGHALLRAALARRGLSPSADLRKAENGKPFLPGLPGVFFNLSHAKGVVVCALSDKEVGIDLEKVRPMRVNVSRKFTEEEQSWLKNQSEDAFFSLWVKKEAVLKCTGTGLTVPLDSFSVLPAEENAPLPGLCCRLLSFPLPDWRCAVCGTADPPGEFHFISKEELLSCLR